MASTENDGNDVVTIDLPAPQGWTKKYTPRKSGTPRRNEIVFIAPTGEEIKNKRQLDQYLKSHPDGPSAAEFDWGTGDTPRRSSRLSSRPKATETPESGSSRKRQRRSTSKKEEGEDKTDGEGESADDETAANKSDNGKDVEMKDAEAEEKAKDASLMSMEGMSDEGKQQALSDGQEMKQGGSEVEVRGEQANAEVPEGTVSYKSKEKLEENKVEVTVSDGQELSEDNKIEKDEKPADSQVQQAVPSKVEDEPIGNKVETVPNEKEEKPEENKVETGEKQAENPLSPGTIPNKEEEQPMANKMEIDDKQFNAQVPQAAAPNNEGEKPDANKLEGTNLSDTELPKEINNAKEEEPVEKPAQVQVQPEVPFSMNISADVYLTAAAPATADMEIEVSNPGKDDQEEKANAEQAGTDPISTQEAAKHGPSAAPISC